MEMLEKDKSLKSKVKRQKAKVKSEIVYSEIVNSDIDTDYKPWPQRKRPAEQARTKFKGQRIKDKVWIVMSVE